MGVEVTRLGNVEGYSPRDFVPRARLLAKLGTTTVLDVGANRGQYARSLRAAGYAGRILSFEPVAEPFRELAGHASDDPGWDVFPFALGDSDDEAVIQVADNSAGSSFLQVGERLTASYPEMGFVSSETVTRRRLDGLVEELAISDAFLKLDVQGFERHVLRGAEEALRGIDGCELELSFTPLYSGESTLLEMTTLLDGLGFGLIGFIPGVDDASTGLPIQVDGLYERRPS